MKTGKNNRVDRVTNIGALAMTAMLFGAAPLASAGDQSLLGNTLRFHAAVSTAAVQAATEPRSQAGTTLRFAGSLTGEMRSREAGLPPGTTLRFVAPHGEERANGAEGMARVTEPGGRAGLSN